MEKEEMALRADEIAKISARCERATLGPWISYLEGREMWGGSSFIRTGGEDIYLTGATAADQDFIAGARQDIPRLEAEITRLSNILAEYHRKKP